jgi:hypothetical protein
LSEGTGAVVLVVTKLFIEPNTVAAEATTSEIILPPGTIRRISVMVPRGHQAESGLRMFLQEFQIVPISPDDWLEGDGETIEWEEWLEIGTTNRVLKVKGYNLDINNDHTFYIRLNVQPPTVTISPEQILGWLTG